MHFVDEAIIEVEAGKGGDGCVSFRREKYRPYGGPDGGDGGDGGSVILRSDAELTTLLDHRYKRHYKAKHGEPGRGKDCYGASRDDLIIKVPIGTVVYDCDSEQAIGDLDTPAKEFVVAKGGRGGKGNIHFKSSTSQAPRKAETGVPGEKKKLRLELRLLADVGVVGFPNAGKSTLVATVSRARPKIADYPFTTLVPSLGVVQVSENENFVIADVPGLIEDAHLGSGLGDRFLKHLERCRILVHLVTWHPGEPADAAMLFKRYEVIEREMALFDSQLAAKDRVVAISKIDLPEVRSMVDEFAKMLSDQKIPVIAISAATGEGVSALVSAVAIKLRDLPLSQA